IDRPYSCELGIRQFVGQSPRGLQRSERPFSRRRIQRNQRGRYPSHSLHPGGRSSAQSLKQRMPHIPHSLRYSGWLDTRCGVLVERERVRRRGRAGSTREPPRPRLGAYYATDPIEIWVNSLGLRQAGLGFFVYLDAGGAIGSAFASVVHFEFGSTLPRQPLDARIRANHLCLFGIGELHFLVFGSLERQGFSSSINADQLSFEDFLGLDRLERAH